MRTALSIAGSDPTGGAGLQLDLQVFRLHGVHGAGVPTALTIQDTRRVHSVLPTFPSVMLDQLRVLLAEIRPAAVKLGMLATDDVARSVMLALTSLGAPPPALVIDPVLAASDGTELLENRARSTLEALIRGATLVTPNLAEAARLTGEPVDEAAGVRRAAEMLVEEFGAQGALIKGGHRDGPADDFLVYRENGERLTRAFSGARIDAPQTHGTGCALSAAITAHLARGAPLVIAVEKAREFVRAALERAVSRGPDEPRLLDFGDSLG